MNNEVDLSFKSDNAKCNRKRKYQNNKNTEGNALENTNKTIEISSEHEASLSFPNKNKLEKSDSSKSKLPKADRQHFNFWNKPISKSQIESTNNNTKCLLINNLKIGISKNEPIKLRITYKSFVKETANVNFINIHGMDSTAEIALIMFGKECTKLFENLQVNRIFSIVNFYVDEENPKYLSDTGNKLQIKLNYNSLITNLTDDGTIPNIPFNFVSLENIQKINTGSKVDIIGIMIEDYGIEVNNKGSKYREFCLTDSSKEMLTVIIWLSDAENFSCEKYSAIVIRRANVIKYNGINKLNCLAGTLIWCDSKIPEALEIENWFKEEINKEK